MTHAVDKVLVGFDGSVDAERALTWAIDEAAARHAAVHAVIARGDGLSLSPRRRDWVPAVIAQRVGLAEDILGASDLPAATVEVIDGSPAEVLVNASELSALVVLGSQGHGRISGPRLGSVSQHVARHAAGPVVVIRPAANPGGSRIVVGVDGSGSSAEALDFAFEQASRTGAALFVLYAWQSSAALTMGWGGAVPLGAMVPVNVEDEAADAELLLAETVAGLSEKYPDVEVYREAVRMPAARALADASQNAAMVVVGSRGRGAFAGLLLGSVSQSVLHHAECPVAIVR